jgi:hypothetical protein
MLIMLTNPLTLIYVYVEKGKYDIARRGIADT